MIARMSLALSLAITTVLAALTPAALGQEGTPAMTTLPAEGEVIAGGLTNPRGFTWAEDGTLYVSLAGTGGSNLPTEDMPIIEAFGGFYGGPSASVARVKDGCPVTVADDLPSYIDGSGAVVGVSDVAFLDGQLYATVDGGGAVHGNPNQPAGLYRIHEDGTAEVVANLSAWIRANPVAEVPAGDNDPDGEIWRLLPTSDNTAFWVVETNQGQLLRMTPTGEITRIADLSVGHPISTGLAPAPDGGVYIGNLTAFPYLDGTAKVIHVAPDGTATDHWTGLTAVVDLAIGPDGALYALELATGSIDEDPFVLPDSGRIVRQTGPDTLEVMAEGLNFPVAFEFGADGALYLASPAMGAAPGTAMLTRWDLLGDASAGASAMPMAAEPCFAAPAA